MATASSHPAAPAPTFVTPTPSPVASLQLGIATAPAKICVLGSSACSAGVGTSRVTLTATGTPGPLTWPAVQIVFVVETSPYDGVWDPYGDGNGLEKWPVGGYDECAAQTNGVPCEESNGVPFFVAHAGQVAGEIQNLNPHTVVTFAMVDYLGTCDNWDDCDSTQYHVDISQFVPSSDLGGLVTQEFQDNVLSGGWTEHDVDLGDNFLHSSSISALYGALVGSGLGWSPNTHHVVVWMGSTSPRDPSYSQNYCASPSGLFFDSEWNCVPPTCEPSYQFSSGARSPSCEGWIHPQDGNPNDSIAALARNAPSCTDSIGGTCTIDVLDLWDTPTDPYSSGWERTNPAGVAYGPGSATVVNDADKILTAGCDIAAATGGTWDGPSFFTCSDGQSGDLQYVAHGPVNHPNTGNPTLFAAMSNIGFGPVTSQLIANGTAKPMFVFAPASSIALAPSPQIQVACQVPSGFAPHCQESPTIIHLGGHTFYGWNWSTVASENKVFAGDLWTASFNVVATGPPYGQVPVDACVSVICKAAGSASVDGVYTWANYELPVSTAIVTQSFPLSQVWVVTTPTSPPTLLPPPPPPPPATALPIATPATLTSIPNVIGLFTQSVTGNVSIQSSAAGLIMAGVTRVMMKNKPIAMQVAVKAGPASSKFDKAQSDGGSSVGHFE
ncbi:MAG: hypothetical protein L3K19_00505 [Thermoplasmata archaeon]|nr:hypothetical protein [Thermoplasmata archaeon]